MNVSKGFDLLRQGRRNRSRLSPFPKAKSHQRRRHQKFPAAKKGLWCMIISPSFWFNMMFRWFKMLLWSNLPIFYVFKEDKMQVKGSHLKENFAGGPKNQAFPISSRKSFTWIILKTILCLVLNFQEICWIEHLTTLTLKRQVLSNLWDLCTVVAVILQSLCRKDIFFKINQSIFLGLHRTLVFDQTWNIAGHSL